MMQNIKTAICFAALSFSAVSCNLDKFPSDSIATQNAMESVTDAENFRIGLYAATKNLFTGGYVYVPDIQADCYHAVDRFTGSYRSFYGYTLLAGEGTCNNVWYGLYGFIANANFLIEGIEDLRRGNLTGREAELLDLYYGEAHYLRAHAYLLLSEFFCQDYEPETASDENTGVLLVTRYRPSSDSSTYPGRGTLEDTFKRITDDLSVAEQYIHVTGSPNSAYITEDVVKALQARVALAMHDYQTAFNKAEELISGGRYPLVSDAAAYKDGWLNDNLSETIWQPVMIDLTDTGNSMSIFLNNPFGTEGNDQPQYVPEDWVLDLYDTENDIRYGAYFEERSFEKPVSGRMTLLVKYPGNPKFDRDNGQNKVPSYINQPKVFRISEMYLLAAEAASHLDGQEGTASGYLNDLKAKRIEGWTETSYSGAQLTEAIRDERVRELFGEGRRMNDIKRWHIGFRRSGGQDPDLLYNPGGDGEEADGDYLNCERPADDPFFLWPIPTTEVQSNPNCKQNPAYTNQ